MRNALNDVVTLGWAAMRMRCLRESSSRLLQGCTSHSHLLPVWPARRVTDVRIALKKADQDSRTSDKVQRWPIIDPPPVVELYFDVWRNGYDVRDLSTSGIVDAIDRDDVLVLREFHPLAID